MNIIMYKVTTKNQDVKLCSQSEIKKKLNTNQKVEEGKEKWTQNGRNKQITNNMQM